MKSFYLPNRAARLVVLQRIELISSFLKKIRKLFGRNFFTSIVTKYFLNSKQIGTKYYEAMQSEFLTFKEYIDFNEAKIHIEDRGLQFGDSVYEVLAILGKKLKAFGLMKTNLLFGQKLNA